MDNNTEERRSLYIVIPAQVWESKKLIQNAKILYGELSYLACSEGYCWATNAYLAKRLKLSPKTITKLLKQLKDQKYIFVEVERDKQSNEVIRRKIWICTLPDTDVPPPPKNGGEPPLPNAGTSPTSGWEPPLQTEEKNNISISNTSNIPPIIPPEGGSRPRKKRRGKSIPTWNPERFEKFWVAYPRDENRARAVEEWDKLGKDKALLDRHGGSDKALLDEIARGLQRHLDCADWREQIGIPHAFRWLRDRRWTEKQKTKPDCPVSRPQEPPKKYHYEVIDGEEMLVWDE